MTNKLLFLPALIQLLVIPLVFATTTNMTAHNLGIEVMHNSTAVINLSNDLHTNTPPFFIISHFWASRLGLRTNHMLPKELTFSINLTMIKNQPN
ncbi:MAG: hypothetical protein M3Y53_07725 [Thermoproteota archaeon]|nr:hypothetical protein [Thermoproteota archaeon]